MTVVDPAELIVLVCEPMLEMLREYVPAKAPVETVALATVGWSTVAA